MPLDEEFLNTDWIVDVRIRNEEGDWQVNGNMSVPNNLRNRQAQEVTHWATIEGNVIAPYDPYFGWSNERATIMKSMELEAYTQELSDMANGNPYVGFFQRPEKTRRRIVNRINRSSNGNPKSQLDKNRDEALSNYLDDIEDSNDVVTASIDALSTPTEIMAIDVATSTTWAVWTPPA